MINDELNDRLTKLGPGTPLGNLLRRYWFPIATVESLAREPIQRVRILGEDLVLFKGDSGRLGLVAERCPHRGASLAYGFTENDNLRCPYHGWMFSPDGACLEQPNQFVDNPALRAQCGLTAYAPATMGGLVFGCLGPQPLPTVPPFDLFTWTESPTRFQEIACAVVDCNWLQIMENSLDPTHVEWLHGRVPDYLYYQDEDSRSQILSGKHVKVGFDRFEHGIIKRRLREGQSEDADDWKVGHPVLFPYILKVGGGVFSSFQTRTPIDDEHTLHFWYDWFTLPEEYADVVTRVQELNKAYPVPIQRPDGTFLMDTAASQDAMAWVTQGPRTNRTDEHLVQGDEGVSAFRKLVGEQIEINERGGAPMNVFYHALDVIDSPLETSHRGIGGRAERNPLVEFTRNESKYSPRVQEAIRLIDAKLGLQRTLVGVGKG